MEQLLTPEILTTVIKQRPLNSFKGTFGQLLLIGGCKQYAGAILMATSAGVHAGAGLTTCASNPNNALPLNTTLPEAMFIDFNNLPLIETQISKADVIVIGPGLGLSETAFDLLKLTLKTVKPTSTLIIDGSALTLLSQDLSLLQTVQTPKIILTPHQKEWERLSGIKIADQTINTNWAAQQKLNVTVVVKGPTTMIFHPDQTYNLVTCGGPYLATGGMGDILTGIIGAFVAQFGKNNFKQAVNAGVFLHSYTGSLLAENKYVVLPTDIIQHLQAVMRQFMN